MEEKKENKIARFLGVLLSMSGRLDLEAASKNIKDGVNFRGPNVIILACAIVIASIGLNLNSIPVIIGAMLISPLMGPILGLGLGLSTNDGRLVKSALQNFLVMVGISLFFSTIYFLISPLSLEHKTELLARTNPTIYDVMIATVGGIAGMLENSRKETGRTVIPGVAIATALMPPLCTVGYSMATLQWSLAAGAMYLFLINSVFIALATFGTAKYLHYPLVAHTSSTNSKKAQRGVTALLIIMIVPSVISAVQIIRENNFSTSVRRLVDENKTMGRSYIFDYDVDETAKPHTVTLYMAGEAMGPDAKEAFYEQAEALGIVRSQIIIKDDAAYNTERMNENEIIKLLNEKVRDLTLEVEEYKSDILPIEQIFKELRAQHPEISNIVLTKGSSAGEDGAGQKVVVAVLTVSEPLEEKDLQHIQEWLKVRLGVDNVIVYA